MRTRSTVLAGAVTAAVATAAAVAGPATARSAAASTAQATKAMAKAVPAADPGSGFVYGTDSWPISGTGTSPYHEPVIGRAYGGYMGMAGNWARKEGCKTGNFLAWAPANADQANSNFKNHNIGVGTGVYWYMGGPGVDPHYTGGTTQAYHWGEQQAAWTLAIAEPRYIPYPVIWADVELPGIAPAPDNGWNSVYTSPCSGVKKQSYVPAVLDRTVFNGFAAYITSHSNYKVGVYSSPQIWPSIFGSGRYASIPNTYEWTYWQESPHLSDAPKGWCMGGAGGCARFFGGQGYSDKYALMWQWSGGGGVRNGYGDFDQIDDQRMK